MKEEQYLLNRNHLFILDVSSAIKLLVEVCDSIKTHIYQGNRTPKYRCSF